jgi:hypothetical protein
MIRLSVSLAAIVAVVAFRLDAQPEDKRILWIFTNHRTTDKSQEDKKLTAGGKFAIAWDDATDRAIFFQTAFLAAISQATNSNPSFGQGVAGYAKRFG